MSGPWDDYKETSNTASGPWDDFKDTPKQKTVDYSQLDREGVPRPSGASPDNPGRSPNRTWSDDNLPNFLNYSHTTASDIPFLSENLDAMKNIHTLGDLNDYWRDVRFTVAKTGANMAAGLVDPVLHPFLSLSGYGDLTPATNLVNNAMPDGTPLQTSLQEGMGRVLNSMDPGQMHAAPWAASTEGRLLPRRNAEYVKPPEPIKVPASPVEGPWEHFTSQDELPFTNSIEDIAAHRNAQENQADMFNNNQGSPAIPYDPMARVPTDAQAELPLTNSVQDVANHASDPQGQLDMFGGAQNMVSREPLGQIPEITPQVALRRALDAEEAGKAAEAAFWRERAMEMVREERAKRSAVPQEPIHVNEQGTAADPTTMDALTRSTEGITYENVPPDGVIPRDANRLPNGEPMLRVPRGNEWAVDENGIPVRQGLPESTVAPDYVNKYMRQDEPARNDLGNAIQEANGPKLGPDEHYGAGQLDTPSPAFNELITPRRTRGQSQQGSSSIMDTAVHSIAQAIHATGDLVRKTSTQLEEYAKKPLGKAIDQLKVDHMARVSGVKDLILKPKSGDQIATDALKEGRDAKLYTNLQSGLQLAGQKIQSAALSGIGSWLNWQDKRTHFDNKTTVDPIQQQLRQVLRVDPKSYETLGKVLMREQATRTLMSDADLTRSMSPKAMLAYKQLRKAFDTSFDQTNAARKLAGKDPISKEEAYAASLRHGDFKQSLYSTKGELLWHVASNTKMDALKFQKWAQEKFKGNTDIDWKKSEIWNAGDVDAAKIPKDIMESYRQGLRLLDPNDPTTTLIHDSINKINEERGMKVNNFNERFLDKNNIPGFEGNKPWLSDRENAHAFLNAQLGYLKSSNRWNNFQTALTEMNKVLSNEDLIRQQPEILKIASAHVNRELGLTTSKFKELEKSLAKVLPSFGTSNGYSPVALGRSRGNLYNFTSSLKHATYLTQLGANAALALTVPLQSALAVAQHRVLTVEGYKHNPLATLINTINDASAGLARHTMSSMTGKDIATPISPFGKKLLQYAEDNGILDKTVLDESGPLDNGGILSPIKKTLGVTITAPEKLSRYSTFVGFAHHLMQSGKLSEAEAMKKAEEFTNHSVTSMRRSDRPLIVDKLGVTGQIGYTYKSFLFNEYNQLSQLGRLAAKGSPSALLAHVGLLYALGGVLGLPGINELDDGWEQVKNLVSEHMPEHYGSISGLGIRGTAMRDWPTWVSLGPISGATGTNIGSRSSSQTMSLLDPLGNIAAPVQELKELSSAGSALAHPTELRRWQQAIHVNSPPAIKSLMEGHLDNYKNLNPSTPDGRNPDGTMTYVKNNDIMNPSASYNRTPRDEEIRKLGMYSDGEYRTKSRDFANNKEQGRVNRAYEESMKLATRAFLDAQRDKDSSKLAKGQDYADNALKLIPDADMFNSTLERMLVSSRATPAQLDMIKAENMKRLEKIQRAKSN